MDAVFDHHKYNDDLLLLGNDRRIAAHRFPTIQHVLDHEDLRTYFKRYDIPANRAKRAGKRAGFAAVGLGSLMLILASAEHVTSGDGTIPVYLAVLSALAGVSSVAIGGVGILHASKKRRWLHARFMTERIRQFHFQILLFRQREILDSLKDVGGKAAFASKRKAWFDDFKSRYDQKLAAEFTRHLDDDTRSDLWLHESDEKAIEVQQGADLEPLFRAYRELRIVHQIDYANHQLRKDHRIISDAPRRQAEVLTTIAFVTVVLLCAIHLGILIAVASRSYFEWNEARAWTSVIVLWIAVVALAVRVIEQGFQPERELERYQHYRSALGAILDRFDHAKTYAEKLAVMKEMEHLTFDEMRDFIITNERARFVM